MKINIYGVGRSGTKGLQLFLAYLLVKKYGEVKLNYEPYYWRRLGRICYKGLEHDLKTKKILNENDILTEKHKIFLEKLSYAPDSVPVITKFIRANGRISHINDVIKPRHSFVVIRNLFEILNSLEKCQWDFFSTPLDSNTNNWHLFIKNLPGDLLIDQTVLSEVAQHPNWEVRNAFYWYCMNLAALKIEEPAISYLKYDELNTAHFLIADLLPELQIGTEKITDPKFNGENIHTNYPLVYKSGIPFIRRNKKLYYYWQYLRYDRQEKDGKKPLNISRAFHLINRLTDLQPENYGDYLHLSQELKEFEISKIGHSKNKRQKYYQNHSLLKYLQEDIMEKLEQKRSLNR